MNMFSSCATKMKSIIGANAKSLVNTVGGFYI